MAIDWTRSMKQTYEVYTVDPNTWLNQKLLDTVTGASIARDLSSDTVVSGSIDYVGELNEEYVRIYLVAEQDGEVERIPLITMLCQTPSSDYNGKYMKTTISGYSPLLELEGEYPEIGFTIKRNYPEWAYDIDKIPPSMSKKNGLNSNLGTLIPSYCRAHCRAPIHDMEPIPNEDPSVPDSLANISLNTLYQDYVVNQDQTWSDLIFTLLKTIGYKCMVNPMGEVSFYKQPEYKKMQPTWTFDDGNSSILSSDISIERDLYNVPNVIELILTNVKGRVLKVVAENTNESSPISINNRGRRVVQRVINPNTYGKISYRLSEEDLKNLAEDLLVQASSLVYTVSYSHGYCPVYVGDCVRINYESAGIHDERAYVISQSISCNTGCMVEETATFVKSFYNKEE